MNGKERSRNQPRRGESRGDEYTLRIVFSGIVPLVPQYGDDGEPNTFWVLVSNLTEPGRLPPLPGNGHGGGHGGHGHEMPPHRNRFLVSEGHLVSAEGRSVQQGEVCEEPGTWDWVELRNEHLTLDADSTQTGLEIVEGPIQPPVPCDQGTTNFGVQCTLDRPRSDQERDFQWTVDVDRIAAGLTREGEQPPRLRQELFADPYDPPGFPLISARLAFDNGIVKARKLDPQGSEYRVYEVRRDEATSPILRQAVATQVELVLPARGPAAFRSRSLDGSTSDPEPIVVEGRAGEEVTVFVENEPDLPCNDPNRRGPHFPANFHLLDDPGRLEEIQGPKDTSPGPSLNAQCSPAKFSFPV